MPLVFPSSYPGAPRYLFNGHLQTIIPGALRQIHGLSYQRERLELPDGDFLDLDWVRTHQKRLVIVTHGLEGDSGRHYVKGTAKLFSQEGWDALAWNCRSCSGEMNRAFRLYNHGEIGDIEVVIRHALQVGKYEEICLVGFSMGGNITLKYLGVYGSQVPKEIKTAVAFSAPLDLHSSAKLLDHSSNAFYKKRFLTKLSRKIRAKALQHPGLLDLAKLKTVKVWRDFDEAFSAVLGGYQNADDFYTQASARYFLAAISVPVLVVNAQNDPILTPECTPTDLAKEHPFVFLESPKSGGHVGFLVAGDEFSWAERRALAFAQSTFS
ncbi:YheT family hydrolase [Arundinibacter roseus]|uniref:Alpha/beta fold hydrolase n=1 Tax=Arundinibacter roseus TaxID=2070510 RepID=A0A4R4KGK9_9BACT|nr:alpha/beta fold hydrolase [Arundinibacter roseus]TDB66026.1 alpha/beta fold hydrolase [Arundinibacter roseus]